MGLKPLEFSGCLLDSPYFRDTINEHEKELDETNESIKNLIKECGNFLKALENLGKSQSAFQDTLRNFKLRYIGEIDTDDEIEIEDAFTVFAQIIAKVEEERERMCNHVKHSLIDPLDNFRKEQIGKAKEEKRKFDKETERICNVVDKHLSINPKKNPNALQEADAQMNLETRNFKNQSLSYVSKLQEVNEKKKFEFVEIMLSFIRGQQNYYHTGHDVFCDYADYLNGLQYKLQMTRERFDVAQEEAEVLKSKLLKRYNNGELAKHMFSREGYLTVLEKKKGVNVLGSYWVKHYCMYQKENKILTMIAYTQTSGKVNTSTDTFVVTSCVRRATESSDRRFCIDVKGQDRSMILQAQSEEDHKSWLEVMDGREPIYLESSDLVSQNEGVTNLSYHGIEFVKKCISAIEKRGIEDQGLYRIAGVSSKFNKLLQTALDPKQLEKLDLESEDSVWEVKTITSAMKQYFRNLSTPLLTFKLHAEFLSAIKLDTYQKRIEALQELIAKLPDDHVVVLNILMMHLKNVASFAERNLMKESNLGVVLGPTLMRPKEETMAAIMSIKYQSVVVETMIKEYETLFTSAFIVERIKQCGHSNNTHVSFVSQTSTPVEKPLPPSNAPPRPMKYPAPLPPQVSVKPKPAARPRPMRMSESGEATATDGANIKVPSPSLKRHGSSQESTKPAVQPAPKNANRFAEVVPLFTTPTVPTASKNADNEHVRKAPTRADSYENAMAGGNVKGMTSYLASVDEHSVDTRDGMPPKPLERISSAPSHPPPTVPKRQEWRVRTLYNCNAENDQELSFNAGAIITNVKNSSEPGWLIGSLNGRTGLIPNNYCEKIE